MQKRIRTSAWIFLAAVMLLVSVAATTVAVMERMNMYYLDDSGAMPINSGIPVQNADLSNILFNIDPIKNAASALQKNEGIDLDGSETIPSSEDSNKMGFQVSSDNLIWGNNTEIEIFKMTYENENGDITVKSENGEAVIAPGTGNSTAFKLKNTGNVPLDYYVNLNLIISSTNEDLKLPLKIRLSRYDGVWIVGGPDEYMDVYQVSSEGDTGVLGPGKYIYYTLDWIWPFEGEEDIEIADMFDTGLGNLKVEEELVFLVELESYAMEGTPGSDGGIIIPETGDTNRVILWSCIGAVSFVVLLLLILWIKKIEKESQSEAKKS